VAADNVHLADAVVPGLDLVGVDVEASGRSDVDGHGTAIAGIIAARPVDGSGLVGIAPDATILPVRVFYGRTDDAVAAGTGPDTGRLAAGIVAAADAGAQVINVSLSVSSPDPALEAAVAYATDAGSLVVASAGNRTTSDTGDTADGPRWPAAYDGVLAVAAVGADGAGTADAIHGPHVLVAAPGTDVLTTFFGAGDCVQGGASSTSWATAYVSGAAALVAARYPQETPAQWAYRLEVTAARVDPAARDDVVGWGIVRPDLALAFVDDGAAQGPASPTHARPASAAVTVTQVAGGTVARPLAAVQRQATWWALVSVAAVLAGALALRLVGAGRRSGRRGGPA
jgi:subtilisin family serine protease